MLAPRMPDNESARLGALVRLGLAGPGQDARCQRYARLARALMDTPIAAVGLVDATMQWFRGRDGPLLDGTARTLSFCAHAIHERRAMCVADAAADPRFSDNPLVTGAPHIRFYAGCPIVVPGDLALGTLCVIDRVPRIVDAHALGLLRDLADCLQSELATQLAHAVALATPRPA